MKPAIRLLMPSLLDEHMLKTLAQDGLDMLSKLQTELRKADLTTSDDSNLITSHYQLGSEQYFTAWMLAGENNHEMLSKGRWLRADPVILEATHNGIVCRGNSVLALEESEREEIEMLFNKHFLDDGLVLQFHSESQAYMNIGDNQEARFSPLAKVLGQDISHHLPEGEAGRFWQRILMETQMLLHRAQCNIERTECGEKAISGLWFWGNPNKPAVVNTTIQAEQFYCNDALLRGAFDGQVSGPVIPQLNDLLVGTNSIEIMNSELRNARDQNDVTDWQNRFTYWLENYIFPTINLVKTGEISELELYTETQCYSLKPWHKYRLWR